MSKEVGQVGAGGRRKKGDYTQEAMNKALQACRGVDENGVKIKDAIKMKTAEAARKFGVPESTLGDRVRSRFYQYVLWLRPEGRKKGHLELY